MSCCVEPRAALFTLHCSSSLSCTLLQTVVDTCLRNCLRALIAAWLDASYKSRDGVRFNRSVYAALCNPKDLDTALQKTLPFHCDAFTLKPIMTFEVGWQSRRTLTSSFPISWNKPRETTRPDGDHGPLSRRHSCVYGQSPHAQAADVGSYLGDRPANLGDHSARAMVHGGSTK